MTSWDELLARHPLPDAAEGGKEDKGHVFIIGGPPTCPGAPILTATAALRMGTGRVQLAVDPAVAPHVAVAIPETAVFAWNQKASPPPEIIERLRVADAVVIGPGHQFLDDIVVRSTAERSPRAAIILDAGALHSVFAVARSSRVLIAPNPTEAMLLLDPDGESELRADDVAGLARALTERIAQPVAVRGATTVVADNDETFEFTDAPPGLGTPGSGDVFIGILAALVASGCPDAVALGWAVQLHAAAARRLASATPTGYLASEIVGEIPHVRPR